MATATRAASRRLVLLPGALALLMVLALVLGPPPLPADAAPPAKGGNVPKNVIVMVADGMSFNTIDATSLYAFGKTRYQVEGPPGAVRRIGNRSPNWIHETFPHQLAVSTYPAQHDGYDPVAAWSDFWWVMRPPPFEATESAAAATSMSTGYKTIDPHIGLDEFGNPVEHLAERAKALGKATGVISDVTFNHATPAAFLAHNLSRNARHALAREMILESGANVIMGAGHPFYDDDARPRNPRYFWIDQPLWDQVQAGETDYTFIDDPDDFRALATTDSPPTHVLGIARAYQTLQMNRFPTPLNRSYEDPNGLVDPFEEPFEQPFNSDVPTLAEMTLAGLNVLSNASDEGFFVMVEGGGGDWASHWNLLGRMIEETLFFHEAIEAVVDWIERESSWSETLLVVTADHDTGYLMGPDSGPSWTPLTGSAGELPEFSWHHYYHTNQLVPFFAKGQGAQRFRQAVRGVDPIRGAYIDNTDVANVIFDLWPAS